MSSGLALSVRAASQNISSASLQPSSNRRPVLRRSTAQAIEVTIPAVKTNAARILDRLGIGYTLQDYEVDERDLSAGKVAAQIGMPIEQVFKTLVARGDRTGVLLAVVPGDAELDLKALARLSGDRSAAVIPLKEVQPLTGYVRGGVTALGTKKPYPVFADESVQLHDRVAVSAGVRGTQILIAPADYLRATGARLGPIARTPS